MAYHLQEQMPAIEDVIDFEVPTTPLHGDHSENVQVAHRYVATQEHSILAMDLIFVIEVSSNCLLVLV